MIVQLESVNTTAQIDRDTYVPFLAMILRSSLLVTASLIATADALLRQVPAE